MSKLYIQPLYHAAFTEFVDYAQTNGYNLEIATFGYQNVYDTDWIKALKEHQQQLSNFDGQVSMHGVYEDVPIHSNDPKIAALAAERIRGSIQVAKALNAAKIVFHGAANPMILNEWYCKNWIEKNAAFWKTLLNEYGGTVLIENVWEPNPTIFRSLLDEVASPRLKICFDVAHANVYSKVPIENWLTSLGEDVVYMHFSDNNSQTDQHAAIGSGNINWQNLTNLITKHGLTPDVVLEECTMERTKQSLDYMKTHNIYPF
jgi:sugar phosphate isomerase/epimerase